MHNEKRLAQRIVQGERRAFEEFVDAFGGKVHCLVRRYVDNPSDAEDLTQEIFCDLHRSLKNFRGDSALATWVHRVALNHCLKYRQKLKPESLPLDDSTGETQYQDWRADPAKSADRQELSEQVNVALNQLSPSHHEIVVLCEMNGLTYQECAETLHIPIGTVKSRLFHAFRKLRLLLGGYVQETSGTLCPETTLEGRK